MNLNTSPQEFARRRRYLMQHIGKQDVAILFSASEKQRNSDVHYPFRQNSDFFYLTGFEEPNAAAIFIAKNQQFVLFCEENDPETAQWTGEKAGLEGAMSTFGAHHAFSIKDLDSIAPELIADTDSLYFPVGLSCHRDRQLSRWTKKIRSQVRAGINMPKQIKNIHNITHEMRLIKSAGEIRQMRHAAKISSQAHIRAMQTCQVGQSEYHLEAMLKYNFMQSGCPQEAYPAIVGAGNNACVLHYTDNNQALHEGNLVLIDAGAEYNNYAADITRTFPINGKFNPAQKAIYELVLKAQLAAIQQVKPGRNFNDPHKAAVRVLTKGLVTLKLLKGEPNELIKTEAYRKFYMHRTGHWLGLDVHDVGSYKTNQQWRKLKANMVLTVEPGLYIPHGCKGVAKKWWGIGIRIEDDVLVTSKGCDILSKDAPKTVTEIEQIMKKSP